MKAIVINGCNNFGKSIILNLIKRKYDIVLVDKNKKQLEYFKDNLGKEIEIVSLDLSSNYNCKKLFNKYSEDNIRVIINCTNDNYSNSFIDEKLDHDLDLIDNNIVGVHVITKLFLKYFEEKKKGYILNIIPDKNIIDSNKMATYMAAKSYVDKLTKSINYELSVKNVDVYIGLGITNFVNIDKTKDYTEEANILIEGMLNKENLIKIK